MTHRMANRNARGTHTLTRKPVEFGHSRETLTSICRELGPCVYFIRTNDGLIKIGHTTDLMRRKRQFRVDWTNLLAITPGSRQDERQMHRRFAKHLAHGEEWFHPAPEILDHINQLRAASGIALVEPW